MVIPRSSSRAFESIETPSSATPVWRIKASVKVVFPWSTCAIIAMFRISIGLICGRTKNASRERHLYDKPKKLICLFVFLKNRERQINCRTFALFGLKPHISTLRLQYTSDHIKADAIALCLHLNSFFSPEKFLKNLLFFFLLNSYTVVFNH